MLYLDFQTLYEYGAWLGGNDIDVEDEWRWVTSGDLVIWTNWDQSAIEPNGGRSENCMLMYVDETRFDWVDTDCEHDDAALCEFACV